MFSPKNLSINSALSDGTLLSIQEVEERIHQLLAENSDLRNTLQQNNTYMRQLSVTLIEWQEEVVRVQNTYRNKFEKAKELVLKLKTENAELKKKIDLTPEEQTHFSFRSAPITVPTNHQPTQEGAESFDGYVLVDAASPPINEGASKENKTHHSLPINCDSPINDTANAKEESDHLMQQEIDSLRTQLKIELESNKNKQSLLNQTQNQLDRLMADFQEMSKKMGEESQMTMDKALYIAEIETLKEANLKIGQHREQLETQLASKSGLLVKAEEIALSKQIQNTEQQTEIARLTKSLETIDVLKAQIDLYQADFEAEREARQNLAGEKEALAQEVRVLKRKLEEKLENSSSASVASGSSPNPPPEQEIASGGQYECPKCSFKYPGIESLNNHLDICLNQHMFP